MKKLLVAEFDAFAASYDRPRNVGLRRNPQKGAQLALPEFGLTPVPWCADGFYYDAAARPGLSPLHEAGCYYLQEPSAMAPAELLDVQPGMRVLDLCAAPGGKSTQLAAKLAGCGLLVCNEIHPKRAQILAQNIERMGIANTLVLNEHPKNLSPRFDGYFDRVLVDAPCSGEGMFRKEEAAVADWSEETVAMCAARQIEILRTAASLLRPGGRLVYSTCTFAPQENEGTISAFLQEHPDFSVIPIGSPYFSPGRPDWIADPAAGLEGTARLWPHHLRGEGHFAAVLQKSGDAPGRDIPTEPGIKAPKEVARIRKHGRRDPAGGEIYTVRRAGVPRTGRTADAARIARPALRTGAWRAAQRPARPGARLGALAANGCIDARSGSERPAAPPLHGRRVHPGRLRGMDARAGRGLHARLGQGFRRAAEKPLSEGAAAPTVRYF